MIFAKKYNIFYVSRETNSFEVNVSRETFITTKKEKVSRETLLVWQIVSRETLYYSGFFKIAAYARGYCFGGSFFN